MKIVIVGDGKVGYTLATELSQEGHDITVIDNNAEMLARIEALDVKGIKGNGASYWVQTEADVPHTDLLIAVTSSDELNIICCLLARKLGAKHTIARTRNPEYSEHLAFLKEELGLSMLINPEKAAASEITRVLSFPSTISAKYFAKGRVELVECRIRPASELIGRRVFDVRDKLGLDILVCVLERKGEPFIPDVDTVFMSEDKVHVTGSTSCIVSFLKRAGHTVEKFRSVMIIGGGRISVYLTENILKMGMRVKIIEVNKDRCAELCELLPKALIIQGDGTDQQLMNEEQVSETDAFVALTDIDEENVFASLHAVKQGAKKVIAKVNRLEYMGVIQDMGIDSLISPKMITAHQIVRYVRAMQNTMGSKVDTLVRIANENIEVLEFTVAPNTKHQGEPLKNIEFKENLMIAAVVNMGKMAVPYGNTKFFKGNTVIVITMHQQFNDMNDIFAD